MNIYVPDDSYTCYVVIDKDTLRGYKTPSDGDLKAEYRDYYINSHYLYKDGFGAFNEASCIPSEQITTNPIYRNDIFEILTLTFLIGGVLFYFVNMALKNLFLGWRR